MLPYRSTAAELHEPVRAAVGAEAREEDDCERR